MNTDAGSRQDLPRQGKNAAGRRSAQGSSTTFCASTPKNCTPRRRRAPGEGATHGYLEARRVSRLSQRRDLGLTQTAAEVLAFFQDEVARSQNGDINFGTSQVSDDLGYPRQVWKSKSGYEVERPHRSIYDAIASLRVAGLLVEVSPASFGGWLGSRNREAKYRLADSAMPGSESTYRTFFARHQAENSSKNKTSSKNSCREIRAFQDIPTPSGVRKSKRKTTHPISEAGMAPSGREQKSEPALEIVLGSPEAVAEVVGAIEEGVAAIAGQRPDRPGVETILRAHLSRHGQAAMRSASEIASAMAALGTRLQALQRQGGLSSTPTGYLLGAFRALDPGKLRREGEEILARERRQREYAAAERREAAPEKNQPLEKILCDWLAQGADPSDPYDAYVILRSALRWGHRLRDLASRREMAGMMSLREILRGREAHGLSMPQITSETVTPGTRWTIVRPDANECEDWD